MRAAVVSLLSAAALLAAADPTFILETRSPESYTRAYLGNGQIGLSTSRNGAAGSESFVAGVYDHASGDVPRIALVPAWNEVDVSNGRAWLNQTHPALRLYRQTLDMYDGTLHTQYDWTEGNRTLALRIDSFVSRADAGLGAVRVQITPRYRGPVRVRLPLRAWPAPKRYPLEKLEKLPEDLARDQWLIWYPGRMIPRERHAGSAFLQMLSQAEGTSITLGEAVALTIPKGLTARTTEAEDEAAAEVAFTGQSGRTYVFSKYAVMVPSFESQNPLRDAAARARAAEARGWDALAGESARAWHDIWKSDIITEGDPQLQSVVHSMLFHLLGSARAGSRFSVPPMGLATSGYYGHFFWDADTYMFPPLLLLHPEMAAPMIMFRSRTLDAARVNARKNGYKGAMYPWEADPDGAESTPRFAYQNALYENHVNGDVALAAWWYFLATGDRDWLARRGFPIIRDTADFWTSRVTFNAPKDRYEIGGVVSVNESLIGISNDAYTNAVAKKNLDLAILAAKTVAQPVNPKWDQVSSKLWLPRQDMLLIDYPLEFPLPHDTRREIATDSLAHPHEGAMMGSEFSPILGVELSDVSLIDSLLPGTWKPYVRPPFNVLPETPTNNNINFITGAGAFLQQFLYGYSGLRLGDSGLANRYSPLLPSSVKRLVLKGITVRGRCRDIVVENGSVR